MKKSENKRYCVAARGATIVSSAAARFATAILPMTGTAISGFVAPGLKLFFFYSFILIIAAEGG